MIHPLKSLKCHFIYQLEFSKQEREGQQEAYKSNPARLVVNIVGSYVKTFRKSEQRKLFKTKHCNSRNA